MMGMQSPENMGRASSHSFACAPERALARDIATENRKRQGSGTCVIYNSVRLECRNRMQSGKQCLGEQFGGWAEPCERESVAI